MINQVRIYKDNLINNVKQVKTRNPNSLICAMIKANAYGVGDAEVVKSISDKVDFFGVACFFEAEKIKDYTDKEILIFGELEKSCIDERFCYSCHSLDDVIFLVSLDKKIKIHISINTGMNRFGFCSKKEFKRALDLIKHSRLYLQGVYTHFATTDEFVDEQMSVFNEYIEILHKENFFPIIHADNSAVNKLYNHHLDMVRVGFDLYLNNVSPFLPVIEIGSRVVQINNVKVGQKVGYSNRYIAKEDCVIAVLPVGYADGLDMKLIGFEIVIDNVKCKIVNICMDCCMIDVTNIKIKKEDFIFLVNVDNSISRYAKFLHTHEYEIMTRLSQIRAERNLIFTDYCD